MATDRLEVRMARLEGAYEQIDRRLGTLGAEVHDLRTENHEQFRWIIGLLMLAILSPAFVRLLGR